MEWEEQKSGRKGRRRRLGILLVLVLLGSGFILQRFLTAKPLAVEVALVQRGTVESLVPSVSSGTVTPGKEVILSAEYPGTIRQILVREGERVEAGAIIARLDDREARNRVRSLEASLRAAQQQLEQARLALQMTASLTDATLAQEKARMEEAERNFSRIKSLFARKLVSESAMDQARTEYAVARKRFESALASLREREIKAQAVKVAEAKVEELTASLALARVQLEKMAIRAPFAGIITRLFVEEGEAVGMGTQGDEVLGVATPVAELSDTSRLLVKADIDEVDLGRVRVGQPVRVTLDAYPGRVFWGTLHKIAPRVETTQDQNRTVQVEVSVALPDLRLAIGMSADIEILVEKAEEVLVVPTLAINEGREGKFLWVVEQGKVRARPVQIGLSNWELTEIVSGVREGDVVVVSLNRRDLREGMRVQIVPQHSQESS